MKRLSSVVVAFTAQRRRLRVILSDMAFLAVKGLCKRYGSAVALSCVDLDVEKGEFVTLLGPSGSGKTTLLMAIAGFARLDQGTVTLAGRDITAVEPEDRDFGFVFQGYALFPHMNVAENIAFPLKVRKWDAARIKARVAEMLSLVGLDELALRKPRELSGGQQQRVAIARALVFGPDILLLDEPLSALDRTLRETMQRELKRLHRQTGVTFLYVTHDQEEAIAMSDRIAVFHEGMVVQVGSPRDLYYRPANNFLAGFLGANNVIPAKLTGSDTGGIQIEMLGVRFPLQTQVPTEQFPDDRLWVWIRPEEFSLTPPAEPAIALEGIVADLSFVGSFERLVLRTASGVEITAQLQSDRMRRIETGQRITLHAAIAAIGLVPADKAQ
jgi:putative spermidine/putrescine transport system ATP-binding protein